jgi:ParB family chromosome partitioning protein
MTTQTIPLSQLVPSPDNVRKTKTGIEGLAANIEALGLLQNLQVRPANGKSFEVVAGGRRLAALQLLAKRKKIAPDHPVMCEVRDGADATAISLAENEMREAMHPADQFEAFKKLADEGKGEEEIAARFGVTPHVVRQRLKLAVVSPKLIAAYRKGDMTLDCLMAFTVSDDHKQQEKVWKALPDYARRRPDEIRDALTEKHIAADSKLALFVGVKAYEKAGGAVLRDLFDDENAGWLTDPALLNELAAERLETAAAALRGEGWKWVEIIPGLDRETFKQFGHAEPKRLPPTEEQQEEIEKLTAEGNAILDEHGEDPDDDEVRDRYWEIEQRIEELSEGEATWPDDIKANAGTVIGIGHEGELDIRRGLVRPEDKAAAKKAAKGKKGDAAGTGTKGDAENTGLSAALAEDLTAHRSAALQALLADNPKVALAATVHALALDCLYSTSQSSCLKITGSVTYLDHSAEGIDESVAAKQFDATTKRVTKGMPKQPEKLWAWLLGKEQKTLLAILAVCAACTVDTVQKRRGVMERGPDAAHAGQLGEALKLDMIAYWQPTAAGYFGRVSKDQTLAAIEEVGGLSKKASHSSLKKDALAKAAEKELKGKGWLPAILR